MLEREVRLGRVERSLSQLGKRLESLVEGSSNEKTRASGQLNDIRQYIDGMIRDME